MDLCGVEASHCAPLRIANGDVGDPLKEIPIDLIPTLVQTVLATWIE
jgi:hypothetical protein